MKTPFRRTARIRTQKEVCLPARASLAHKTANRPQPTTRFHSETEHGTHAFAARLQNRCPCDKKKALRSQSAMENGGKCYLRPAQRFACFGDADLPRAWRESVSFPGGGIRPTRAARLTRRASETGQRELILGLLVSQLRNDRESRRPAFW